MFDFGFSELLLIVIAGIFLVGPKDIPELLKNLGRGVRRLHVVRAPKGMLEAELACTVLVHQLARNGRAGGLGKVHEDKAVGVADHHGNNGTDGAIGGWPGRAKEIVSLRQAFPGDAFNAAARA